MALRPDSLNAISICAGAGGLDLALQLAEPRARTVAYVEREAYAAATLVARMETGELAPALVWSDLGTFDARPFRGRVHLVTSGDPCQPNSVAGRGLGADDERFLIDQVVRVFDESGAHRLFRENVTGNADGQLAAIVPLLEGLGCRVAAGIFSAEGVGASHRRERLVIMADRDGARWPAPGCGPAFDTGREPEPGGLAVGAAECTERRPIALESRYQGEERISAGRNEGPDRPAIPSDGLGGFHLVYATGDRRGEGRAEPELWRGRDAAAGADVAMVDPDRIGRWPEGDGGIAPGDADEPGRRVADAERGQLQRRRGSGGLGIAEISAGGEAREQRLRDAAVDRGAVPILCPAPSDVRWLDILDADPLLRPALGRIDLWAVARRNLGLPPVVAAVGRRGGMAWDLDAQTTAAVEREVRRISDVFAPRVDRLRLCGNGVHHLALGHAWIALDALLASGAGAGAAAVRSEAA